MAVVAVILIVIAALRPHGSSAPVPAVPAAAPGDASVPGVPVKVSINGCGIGWNGGVAGPETFALSNPDPLGTEVYLQNVATGQVYFDQEALGARSTRSVSVVLGPGRYRFYCDPQDAQGLNGPTETVTGSYAGPTTPGMIPVLNGDLFKPIAHYHAWVTSRFPTLARQVAALNADVKAGNLAQARKDWLAGHMTYETLGAAYDAFGADNDAINAMPSSSTPAVRDTELFGFHKIEALLWGGYPAARIAPYSTKLVKAVAQLRKDFPTEQLDTVDIGLRSHEIMENALQFVLNGYDDAGSHTSLATLDANLSGTLEAMKPIRSVLKSRDKDLATTYAWIATSQKLVRSYDRGGAWTPLQSLTTHQREALDATISQTIEYLSEVASITTPRGIIPQ